MKKEDLARELEQRGTAEIVNGVVVQATQAIDETTDRAKVLMFGELKERSIIPINEACAKCTFWEGKFANFKECQKRQGKDANARGFSIVICPKQFV